MVERKTGISAAQAHFGRSPAVAPQASFAGELDASAEQLHHCLELLDFSAFQLPRWELSLGLNPAADSAAKRARDRPDSCELHCS